MSAQLPVREEPRWHAALAAIAALALYITLPPHVTFGPYWLLPLLVLGLLVPLLILKPKRHNESGWQRTASIAHIAILNFFNLASVVLLVNDILGTGSHHHKAVSGEALLLGAMQIWLTNVLVFALWFWEIDGGGPDVRADSSVAQDIDRSDFLFPQMMENPNSPRRQSFRPQFFDYLFLAFTNATAFSPTDTFPVTRTAKFLMMAQAFVSIVTIAIVASRAVNIVGG